MILPDEHTRLSDSLFGVGAVLLESLEPRQTVTELWDRTRGRPGIKTFERFVLGLDLLFILGTVDFVDGMVVRRRPRPRPRAAAGAAGGAP